MQPLNPTTSVQQGITVCGRRYEEAKEYEKGEGRQKNLAQAFHFYENLTQEGYTPALVNVAHYLCHGIGTKMDLSRAAIVAKQALSKDLSFAQQGTLFCVLGISYEEGYLENGKWLQDIQFAEEYYQESSRLGNLYGIIFLARAYFRHGHKHESLGVINKKVMGTLARSAESGAVLAQTQLGLCYYAGMGIEQNDALAVRWFQKAAAQGFANAQFYLGSCYASGHGAVVDEALATYCLTQAAEQGHTSAQQMLAKLAASKGLSKDNLDN